MNDTRDYVNTINDKLAKQYEEMLEKEKNKPGQVETQARSTSEKGDINPNKGDNMSKQSSSSKGDNMSQTIHPFNKGDNMSETIHPFNKGDNMSDKDKSQDNGNVENLSVKRQEKVASKKPTFKEIADVAIRWMLHKKSSRAIFPVEFPHTFVNRRRPDGIAEHYEVLPGEVYRRIELEGIKLKYLDAVSDIVDEYGDVFSNYHFEPAAARKFADYWVNKGRDRDTREIADVLPKSIPGPCFHRLDFDPDPEVPAPTWEKLMGNIISNRETMEGWIGALFNPGIILQQYVWLYGDGINGKGTIMDFLHKLLKDASCPLETDYRRINQFTTSILVGKRLAVADDCEHPHFVKSGWFKSASGGAKVRIEEKGKPPVDKSLTCLYAFTSNNPPAIDTQRSNMRRAIFIEFKSSEQVELIPNLPEKLWNERAGIIGRCMEQFDDLYEPKYRRISVDHEANMKLAEENEGSMEDVFWKFFTDSGECRSLDVVDMLRDLRWTDYKIGEFQKFCERRFKIKKVRRKVKGSHIRFLVGMSFLTDPSSGDQGVKF